VEEVANRAHCAKGLVNYHYRSKHDLLRAAAETVRDDRIARRLAAAQVEGTAALDRLWSTMVQEVESGWFAAWLALLAAEDPLRKAAALRPADADQLSQALGRALGLDGALKPRAALIQAALDGLELRLLQGERKDRVEADYHRFWLDTLDADHDRD
jgi:AcrR family transcriptional regulator